VQTLGVASVIAILGDRSADSVALFRRVWIVCGVAFLLSTLAALWYPAAGLAGRGSGHLARRRVATLGQGTEEPAGVTGPAGSSPGS
jgi:hypothetical protein